ncbi:MAG: nitroreductase A [Candidatus Bathyarchaeota archaeon BA2]|nr:MAG: nitroreductase A [Candidatus Bathyarchaeota archaeon BA2]
MEIFDAIKGRRSIRKYTKDFVPEDFIVKILDAGRWAPSAGNSQPWNFIVLRDEELRKRVAETTTYGKFLADASVGIAVVVDPRASTHPVEDGAIATQNMLLAAHALGLGACWIGSYNSVYEEEVKEILGIPKSKRLLSIISLGFPAETSTKTRKELGEITFVDKYGRK